MTLQAFIAQARRLDLLKGEVCVQARRAAGTWLHLGFGRLLPPDTRGHQWAERRLSAACPWRIDRPDSVVVGSGDDGRTIREMIQTLVGRRLTDIELRQPSFTLRLQFSDRLSLWVFPADATDFLDQADYPAVSWYVTGVGLPTGWER